MELTPIEKSGRGGGRIDLAEIPADVAEVVEEVYTFCQANPDKRIETEPFESKEAANAWLRAARSYAYQRPAGRVVVSGNPARVKGTRDDNGPHVNRITVEPFTEGNESETE